MIKKHTDIFTELAILNKIYPTSPNVVKYRTLHLLSFKPNLAHRKLTTLSGAMLLPLFALWPMAEPSTSLGLLSPCHRSSKSEF